MSPVILLSEGYLANSSEPWLIPNSEDIPPIEISHPKSKQGEDGQESFLPYNRHPKTMARPWALPGTAGLEHRIDQLPFGGSCRQIEHTVKGVYLEEVSVGAAWRTRAAVTYAAEV